jgi:hypothetical protein
MAARSALELVRDLLQSALRIPRACPTLGTRAPYRILRRAHDAVEDGSVPNPGVLLRSLLRGTQRSPNLAALLLTSERVSAPVTGGSL